MPFHENSSLTIIVRFARAVALTAFALLTLAVTVAMFWRDVGLGALSEHWLDWLSEAQLTALAGAMAIALFAALRVTQRSEEYHRKRSRIR